MRVSEAPLMAMLALSPLARPLGSDRDPLPGPSMLLCSPGLSPLLTQDQDADG